jgi:ATP-dependent exoDNAse (exonuclease V) beta subunit
LSEKIFKPIANLQPFLVLGDYLTLSELKKLGFKTFEPFIDESYDTERDSYKRMELLEKEIIKLKNMSIDEIHNWYYSIVDILIFNKKHLYSFENYECFESIFEQIKIDYTTQKHTQWNLQEKRLL